MQNPYFDRECYFLHRHIAFLMKLDALAAVNAPLDAFERLAHDFKQVKHPPDIFDRINDVFGTETK